MTVKISTNSPPNSSSLYLQPNSSSHTEFFQDFWQRLAVINMIVARLAEGVLYQLDDQTIHWNSLKSIVLSDEEVLALVVRFDVTRQGLPREGRDCPAGGSAAPLVRSCWWWPPPVLLTMAHVSWGQIWLTWLRQLGIIVTGCSSWLRVSGPMRQHFGIFSKFELGSHILISWCSRWLVPMCHCQNWSRYIERGRVHSLTYPEGQKTFPRKN